MLPPRADVAAVPPHTGQNLPMLFLDLNRVKNLPITAVWEDFFANFLGNENISAEIFYCRPKIKYTATALKTAAAKSAQSAAKTVLRVFFMPTAP